MWWEGVISVLLAYLKIFQEMVDQTLDGNLTKLKAPLWKCLR
jgi:hypothetical protein